MEELLARLRREASRRGLAGLGVCDTRPFWEVRREMAGRRSNGRSGRLRFTYSDHEIATDVRRTYPWAERLIVGIVTYLPAAGRPGPPRPNLARVARFATDDHYRPLRGGLDALRDLLQAGGFRAEVLVDDNRLVDRAAAVRAGLGWWGKSTMVLTPKYGPWTLIGSIATDAEVPTTPPMQRDCGACVACLPACPTGALDRAGNLDAVLCISYWAQMPGEIPVAIREAWGDRLYGCDECLDACPPGGRWMEEARDPVGRVDLSDLLVRSDDDLRSAFSHFYLPRNDPVYLRRNALVALAHCGTANLVPLLVGYLRSPRPVLRTHAAWALGRIAGESAEAALEAARSGESDPAVVKEIETALRSARGRSI